MGTPAVREEDDITVCKVKDLQQYDKIPYGTLLGSMSAAEDLTVKSVEPADNGKFALTIFRVGTIFVHGETTVEVASKRLRDY